MDEQAGAHQPWTPARFISDPKGRLPARLVLGPGESFVNDLLIRRRQLLRPEVEGQLVDLAVEAERHLIVLVVHRRAGVYSNVEGLVTRYQERDRARNLPRGDVVAVHLQNAGAALRDAGAVH